MLCYVQVKVRASNDKQQISFVTIDVITAAMIAFVIRTITAVSSIITHGIITKGAITVLYDMPSPNHHEYKRE